MSQQSHESDQPFPANRRVYVVGSRPDLRVPMREIALTPTPSRFGAEDNPPLRVYDTSGPHTDPEVETDLHRGLPPLRRRWILERADVEEYEGRVVQPRDNGLKPDDPRANLAVFGAPRRRPLRAQPAGP